MTLSEFAEVFGMLAMQLRAGDIDELTVRAYYARLKHLEPEFVEAAAARLADRCQFFPKVAEWLGEVRAVERERLDAQRERLRHLPSPACSACDDTGWERAADCVKPCGCRRLRRAEVLGRRPLPALPPAATSEEPAGHEAFMAALERRLGRRVGARAMPEEGSARDGR